MGCLKSIFFYSLIPHLPTETIAKLIFVTLKCLNFSKDEILHPDLALINGSGFRMTFQSYAI